MSTTQCRLSILSLSRHALSVFPCSNLHITLLVCVSIFFLCLSLAEHARCETQSLDTILAENALLEAENRKLKELLQEEPCVIRNALPFIAANVREGWSFADEATLTPIDPTQIEAATVMILVLEPSFAMGTGFFVAKDIVVTSSHVVAGAPYVGIFSKGLKRPLVGEVIASTDAGGRDYAIIRIEPQEATVAPLPLCATVRKTEQVGTWGFPGVISLDDPKFKDLLNGDLLSVPEAVYSEGVVNVVREPPPVEILHTAVTSHGNSGGPLVNARGCVVGINTYIQEDGRSYRQTSISLGAGDLAAFLRSQGIHPLLYE